jgi:hypothetical protein
VAFAPTKAIAAAEPRLEAERGCPDIEWARPAASKKSHSRRLSADIQIQMLRRNSATWRSQAKR